MNVSKDHIDRSERIRLKRAENLRKINDFIEKRNAEIAKHQRNDTASK
jgi:hypothetical protein